ncbi:hypothetical protein NPIL_220841 [Nephila pilipes]|uniref:Uncharacterized protein n=1 Tax=Nephila pilipes TaxID=299642 RepID=A0A8X6TH42_NEPPI|nr:hypothetical protein NPIL_220841 [Nephila pilipes]
MQVIAVPNCICSPIKSFSGKIKFNILLEITPTFSKLGKESRFYSRDFLSGRKKNKFYELSILFATDYFPARDLLLDSVLLGQKAVRRQLAWDLHPSSQTTLSKTAHGECLWMNIQSRAATVINRALLSMPRVDFDTILKELCEDTVHQTFEKIYVPTYFEVYCLHPIPN